MIHIRSARLAWLPMVLAMFSPALSATAQSRVTDEQIQEAIQNIKDTIFADQDDTGGWEEGYKTHGGDRETGGLSSLVTYSLLASGESFQRKEVRNAINYLSKIQLAAHEKKEREDQKKADVDIMAGVYSVGCRSHVWSHLPDNFLGFLENDAMWLNQARYSFGAWDYASKNLADKGRWDNSVGQYGLLGMWEAAKRNIHISGGFWEAAREHWITNQCPDGGWAYQKCEGKGYASMTTAGLTALLVIQQEMDRQRMTPEPRITEAINKGIAWMDKNFDGPKNVGKGGGNSLYFLYGLERVALASGHRYFNDQDWYVEGARHAISSHGKAKAKAEVGPDTAFALLFLSRGRVPVWITKLQLKDTNWNNRPNDIYFLNQYLSDFGEGEINWQVVGLDRPVLDLVTTPIIYLASDQSIELNDEQIAKLKAAIDQGALLWCNPDGGSTRFRSSVEALLKKMYPHLQLARLPNEHPIYTGILPIPRGASEGIVGLSNGARDLAYIAGKDYGYEWQSDEQPGKSVAWRVAANLYAMATERGRLPNRMALDMETTGRNSGQTVRIGRVSYSGNWLPEQAWHEPLQRRLAMNSGPQLEVTPGLGEADTLKIDDVANFDGQLVTVQGVEAGKFNDTQVQALIDYARKGGTVLIETVGGRGDFTSKLEQQIATALQSSPVPLSSQDAILSGDGLTGGQDATRINYRSYTVLKLNLRNRPRMAAFYIDEKPAIIVTHEDLSLGVIGVPRWGIIGYDKESARRIMNNIVLYAQSRRTGT